MPLLRRSAAVLLAGAALLSVTAASPASAEAGDKRLSGTVLGVDGRAVSALIGFDLRDSAGRALGASGCVRSPSCPVDGYAVTRRVNFDLGPAGSRDTDDNDVTWSVSLPAETARVYVEVHPQGRRYSGADNSRYGASFRRNLPVPYDGRVALRLPLVCDPEGGGEGSAGYVNGYARDEDGRRVPLERITAFSMEPDNDRLDPLLGVGVGRVEPNGYFRIDHLSADAAAGQRPGQRYQLIATSTDGEVRRVYGVRVTACSGTPRNLEF